MSERIIHEKRNFGALFFVLCQIRAVRYTNRIKFIRFIVITWGPTGAVTGTAALHDDSLTNTDYRRARKGAEIKRRPRRFPLSA